MKKVLLSLLLMLVTLTVFSQEELKFSKVIQSESEADKTTLYSTLRSFISTYFHDSKQVIQMDDKDAGIIICKATSIFNSPSLMLSAYEGWIDYNLKLQARDGRVRIEVFHFFHHNKPGNQAKAQLVFSPPLKNMLIVVFKRNTITKYGCCLKNRQKILVTKCLLE